DGGSVPRWTSCPIPAKAWHLEAGEGNGAPATGHRVRKPTRNAGLWEPTVQKIVALQDLSDDWDGSGATAPSPELLESAIGLTYLLCAKGVPPPSRVVPGLEGAVLFEWQDPDGSYADVEIVRPFFAEVMVVEPGKPARHWTLPNQ